MRSLVTTILLALTLAVPAAADFTLDCPAPGDITAHSIPHSVNTIYTAESDGVGFWGMSAAVFEDPPFIGAELSTVNGYHSFACTYGQSGTSLPLTTNTSPAYATCSFEGGGTSCEGSREACAIRCAERPPARITVQELAEALPTPFLDILNQAAAIVEGDFPGASFYEADYDVGQPQSGWRFVFNVPPQGGGINSTAFLHYVDGEFQLPPQHVDSPWGGDRVIPLPIHLGLFQALELATRAGYSAPATYITLRWPLYPGAHEPYYIFAMPQLGVHVFVGVYSHQVHTSPLGRG